MVSARKVKRDLVVFHRAVGMAALIAVLVLAVAGCGGSGEGEQQRSTETQARNVGTESAKSPAGSPAGDALGQDERSTSPGRGADGSDAASLPRLVDLGADKCVPCKMMAPILEELKETYAGRMQVDLIDVWKDPAPGREYEVKVIPTQIFFDENGTELFRHQGFMAREDILAKWAELGYEFEA